MTVSGPSCGRWDLHCDRRIFCCRAGGLCSSCRTQAQLPSGVWDLSSVTRDRTCIPCIRSKILTTGPPGKSPICLNLFTVYSFILLIYLPHDRTWNTAINMRHIFVVLQEGIAYPEKKTFKHVISINQDGCWDSEGTGHSRTVQQRCVGPASSSRRRKTEHL